MADVAISLVGKVADVLQQEAQLLGGIGENIQYISDELEFINTAFLPFAAAKRSREPTLDTWVKQLRDVAQDMEDALDDFRLRVADNRGGGHGCLGIHWKKSCSFERLIAKHRIASSVRSIKSRVVNISESYRRYSIKNSSRSLGHAARLDCQGDALLVEEADLVGIEKPKNLLIGWLVGGNSERKVVSVVGMGGLGKTTLVKKVFDDANVKKRFKFRAWITVSSSMKTNDRLKDIIHQFRARKKLNPQEVENMNNDQLRERIKSILQQRRYLIVLDDVWHNDDWDAIKHALPNNSHGSRILLTTRNSEIASTCCVDSPENVYPLDFLSPEESRSLFCKKVFRQDSCPPYLNAVSESILGRCEGLPLAIVAIGGVLATKDKSKIDEWQMVCSSLGAELDDNDKLKNVRKILSLSYDDLPHCLQSCLLYFSIFPKDHPIEQMKLIRLWIAEGFVKEKDGKTLEEIAEAYLSDLLKRSLIQVSESTTDGRVKTCRIHDLLREIIISKSTDQNFVTIVKEQMMAWPEKARRVSLHNPSQSVQQSCSNSHLRSLLMFWGLDSMSNSSKFKMPIVGSSRFLNVLELEGAPLKEFPEEVLDLRLLKYLSLKNTEVKSIPSSIKKLQNLETLDLKHSHVSELPPEILKLKKLRHLLVYRYELESDAHVHTKYGFNAPRKMGSLQNLQKLCFVIVTRGGDPLLTELGRLIHLRRLGVLNLRKEDGKVLCSSIQNMKNLHALSVNSVDDMEIIDMGDLPSPPQFLQRLYLTGRLEQLPEWIPTLNSLHKIVLKWSRLSVDPLIFLQHLPNLAHLEFVQVYEGQTLCFQAQGFQKLKFLGLNKLDKLESMTVEKGAMPCLEKLIIQGCKLLQKVPLGIEHLTKLKVLQLFDMPNELIMTLRPEHEGEDYQKVAHVLEIYCTYQIYGKWDVYRPVEGFKDGETSNRKLESYIWK